MRSSPYTYLIGRSHKADIVLGDPTVSRMHAELVMGHDQTWFLTDRCSTGGTFLWNIDKWDPIKQEFVCSGDWLKFGEFKCRVDVLLRHLPREGETVSGPRGGKSGTEAPILDDRPQGPVRRDPMTGDVIAAEDQK